MSEFNTMRKIPDYEHLPLSNAWMFGEVMRKGDNAKLFLEELLSISIDHIEYIEKEKTLSPLIDKRGIRMDVYLKDDRGTIYNIEMQTTNQPDNARRIRYYQSMIDTSSLEAGPSFSELPDSFIIFICTFDIAKQGCPIYQKRVYLEGKDSKMPYNDGTNVIFLNTDFAPNYEGEVSESMLEFLRFVPSEEDYAASRYQHTLTQNIARMVDIARNDPRKKEDFMFTELFIQDKLSEGIQIGFEKGIEQGREEGREKGREEGREQGSLQTIISFYQDGTISLETAAVKAGLSPEEFLAKAETLMAE